MLFNYRKLQTGRKIPPMRNVIDSVKALFDKENKIWFKNPINGEIKEYKILPWICLKFFIEPGLLKKGWIQVDAKGMKIRSLKNK